MCSLLCSNARFTRAGARNVSRVWVWMWVLFMCAYRHSACSGGKARAPGARGANTAYRRLAVWGLPPISWIWVVRKRC
ncbi:hypothetical protein C8Q78DRAFT_713899 [Trametes maxima]|nr:hypothetical protein C8Q78DRAFT_713899 [Trametes maxima]